MNLADAEQRRTARFERSHRITSVLPAGILDGRRISGTCNRPLHVAQLGRGCFAAFNTLRQLRAESDIDAVHPHQKRHEHESDGDRTARNGNPLDRIAMKTARKAIVRAYASPAAAARIHGWVTVNAVSRS